MEIAENKSEISENNKLMPLLFLGHGNPINAIEENQFVDGFRNIASHLPKPETILCISAHWFTEGTSVTHMSNPRTIHDFNGFPSELYKIQYPAPGNPQLANKIKSLIISTNVELDEKWGLDHGSWSVIKHLFPKANIPVVQLSIDYTKTPQFHFDLARDLYSLRKSGVLIIGSGNIVHNLRMLDFSNLTKDNYGYEWANEARKIINNLINKDLTDKLINYENLGSSVRSAIPTPEHYLPLLYILGLKKKEESITFFNDRMVGGSLSMTSLFIK